MAYAFSIGYGKAAVDEGAWAFSPGGGRRRWRRSTSDPGLRRSLDLVVILDATALALAICVTIGRGFFALGRDGCSRRVRADVALRQPWVGNLMVLVGGVGLMLLVNDRATTSTCSSIPGPGRQADPDLPQRPVRDLHHGGDRRLVRRRARLPDARDRVAWMARRSRASKWWQYAIVLIAIATPVLGFYGALKPEPHDTTRTTTGSRSAR